MPQLPWKASCFAYASVMYASSMRLYCTAQYMTAAATTAAETKITTGRSRVGRPTTRGAGSSSGSAVIVVVMGSMLCRRAPRPTTYRAPVSRRPRGPPRGYNTMVAVQRVVILGPGGAGKSTLARRLGARTGVPVVHLDRFYWHPGWVETPRDDWRVRQRELFAGDAWIADGNYSATLDERLPRADTVVLLDFPAWRTLPRVVRRSLAHHGEELQADGCPERVDLQFLRWVANYRRRSRPKVLAAIAEYAPGAQVHVLRSPRAVDAFLAGLSR